MKNYDLILIYNYNPFDKKQPYFYLLFYKNEVIIRGEGYSDTPLFNFILNAVNSIVKNIEFEEGSELNVFLLEDDYDIYNLKELVVGIQSLSDKYEMNVDMKEFIENLKKIKINFNSLDRFPKYKKIFKDEFNLHF